jgi:hypothetical protein
MVVVRHGCSDEITNLDQATSLSLQPCSMLSSIPPIVDYASKIKLIWSIYKEEPAVGALGLTVLRPTIRQLLAYLLIRAKAPMTSRDRVLSLKITSCVGYGAKNGVPAQRASGTYPQYVVKITGRVV